MNDKPGFGGVTKYDLAKLAVAGASIYFAYWAMDNLIKGVKKIDLSNPSEPPVKDEV